MVELVELVAVAGLEPEEPHLHQERAEPQRTRLFMIVLKINSLVEQHLLPAERRALVDHQAPDQRLKPDAVELVADQAEALLSFMLTNWLPDHQLQPESFGQTEATAETVMELHRLMPEAAVELVAVAVAMFTWRL